VQRMIQLTPSGASEVLIGTTSDPQFGPSVVFGSGGSLVEVPSISFDFSCHFISLFHLLHLCR